MNDAAQMRQTVRGEIEALGYEVVEVEGFGVTTFWADRRGLRWKYASVDAFGYRINLARQARHSRAPAPSFAENRGPAPRRVGGGGSL